MFGGGRNLGRSSAYRNDGGTRLFINVRCVVPRGGIGLLAVNGGYQTILFFYTSALATLLFSSDSTEACYSFKIDNSNGREVTQEVQHIVYLINNYYFQINCYQKSVSFEYFRHFRILFVERETTKRDMYYIFFILRNNIFII